MGQLKSYYSKETRLFIRANERQVKLFDVAELFAKAYLKVKRQRLLLEVADLNALGYIHLIAWYFQWLILLLIIRQVRTSFYLFGVISNTMNIIVNVF